MAGDYTDIIFEVDDPVAVIRLNRPDRLNAITYKMLAEIRDAIEKSVADQRVVGIVITGEGRGFCAGLDAEVLAATAEAGQSTSQEDTAQRNDVPGMFTYFLKVPKPIIAAVNGVAAGGGFVLPAMSDVRFASTEAAFTTVFSKRGLIAEHGLSWIMPRLMGPGRALDLLWTSRKIGAEEALKTGLVEYVVQPDELVQAAKDYVINLAETVAPSSLADSKRLLYRHMGIEYELALEETQVAMEASLKRFDITEGVQSFLERRPPKFPRLGAK